MEELNRTLHHVEHLMHEGYLEEALEELKSLSANYPNNYSVLSLLGEVYLTLGMPDKAIKPLQMGMKSFPKKKKGKTTKDKQEDQVVSHLRKQEKSNEYMGLWVDHYLLGCAYGRCAKFKPAVRHLNLANDMNPNNGEVLRNLGWINCMKKDHQMGRALLLRSISLDPHNALAHNDLAASYMFDGKFKQARKHLQKALELDPYDDFIQSTSDKLDELEASFTLFGEKPKDTSQ